MKVILPIVEHPFIEAYQMRAYELGALQAYDQSVIPWLYGKYINCEYCPLLREKFNYALYDRWFPVEKATFMQTIRTTVTALYDIDIDLIALTCDMINSGHYVFGDYDEYYIPGKLAYNDHHFKHDFLIYGYDDERRIFYSIGYTVKRIYEKFEFSFDEFSDSIYFMPDQTVSLNYCRINKNFIFKVNANDIKLELGDYLHSCYSRGSKKADHIYGIDCEREYVNYIESIMNAASDIDVRYCRLFMELKNLMVNRLEYIDKNLFRLSPDTIDEYKMIAQKSTIIHTMCIKYNITHKASVLESVARIQNEIIRDEQVVLYDVYRRLCAFLKEN